MLFLTSTKRTVLFLFFIAFSSSSALSDQGCAALIGKYPICHDSYHSNLTLRPDAKNGYVLEYVQNTFDGSTDYYSYHFSLSKKNPADGISDDYDFAVNATCNAGVLEAKWTGPSFGLPGERHHPKSIQISKEADAVRFTFFDALDEAIDLSVKGSYEPFTLICR